MQDSPRHYLQEQNTFLNLDFPSDHDHHHRLTKNFSELSFPGSSLTSTSTLANFHENSDASLPPSTTLQDGDEILTMFHSMGKSGKDVYGSIDTNFSRSASSANASHGTIVNHSTAESENVSSKERKFLSTSQPSLGPVKVKQEVVLSAISDTTVMTPWDSSVNSTKSFAFLPVRIPGNASCVSSNPNDASVMVPSQEVVQSIPFVSPQTLQEIKAQEEAGSALDAVRLIGPPTFSTSFIDDLIEKANAGVSSLPVPEPFSFAHTPLPFQSFELNQQHPMGLPLPRSQESLENMISETFNMSQSVSETSLAGAHLAFDNLSMVSSSQPFLSHSLASPFAETGSGFPHSLQSHPFLNQQSLYFSPTGVTSQSIHENETGMTSPAAPKGKRAKGTRTSKASCGASSTAKSTNSSNEDASFKSNLNGAAPGAKGTSSRRKIVEQELQCQQCFKNSGCVYIRGCKAPVQPHEVLHFICTDCDRSQGDGRAGSAKIVRDDSILSGSMTSCSSSRHLDLMNSQSLETSASDSAQRGSKKRKSARSGTGSIECEVCRIRLGTGGLLSEAERSLKDFKREEQDANAQNSKTSDDDIKTEFTCSPCTERYMFCSECGGGGKQRTGKWRPKELFDSGRRTCSLPHIRVGNSDIHYNTIDLHQSIPSSALIGIQDVFFDCFLSLFGIPSVMSEPKHQGSYESVRTEIENIWKQSVLDIITTPCPSHLKRFVTVGWIDKRHRNKGKGRFAPRDTIPWLERLDIDGVFKSINPPPIDSEEWNRCYVSFCVVEYDPLTETAFILQMTPRSVFLKTMEGYNELLKATLDQIKASCGRYPQHVWCWAKADHTRLAAVPSRLKFIPIHEYLETNPALPPQIFSKASFPILRESDTLLFAVNASALLNDRS